MPRRTTLPLLTCNSSDSSADRISKRIISSASGADPISGLVLTDRPTRLSSLVVHEVLPITVPIRRSATNVHGRIDEEVRVQLCGVESVEHHGVDLSSWHMPRLLYRRRRQHGYPGWRWLGGCRAPVRRIVGRQANVNVEPIMLAPLLPFAALPLEGDASSMPPLHHLQQIFAIPRNSRANGPSAVVPVEEQEVAPRLVPVRRVAVDIRSQIRRVCVVKSSIREALQRDRSRPNTLVLLSSCSNHLCCDHASMRKLGSGEVDEVLLQRFFRSRANRSSFTGQLAISRRVCDARASSVLGN
mmetsp:Transcript_161404/g.518194  ORF Transcript_161404/g.518194 Transcript_161404/m.518194 type:complete len:300 (-) Transcript_161404:287-1186(-)